MHVTTWFERDRAHVAVYNDESMARTICEWWDDDVRQAIEDGFLDARDIEGSAERYATESGLACEGCSHSPVQGVRPDATNHSGHDLPEGYVAIERCDTCGIFDSDVSAGIVWRGGKEPKVLLDEEGSTVIVPGVHGI